MGQAAKRQPQPWEEAPSDLVRRLLARRPAAATWPAILPPEEPAPEAAAPQESGPPQDAAILVLKAALRAERAEVTALQAQLAELRRTRR